MYKSTNNPLCDLQKLFHSPIPLFRYSSFIAHLSYLMFKCSQMRFYKYQYLWNSNTSIQTDRNYFHSIIQCRPATCTSKRQEALFCFVLETNFCLKQWIYKHCTAKKSSRKWDKRTTKNSRQLVTTAWCLHTVAVILMDFRRPDQSPP